MIFCVININVLHRRILIYSDIILSYTLSIISKGERWMAAREFDIDCFSSTQRVIDGKNEEPSKNCTLTYLFLL